MGKGRQVPVFKQTGEGRRSLRFHAGPVLEKGGNPKKENCDSFELDLSVFDLALDQHIQARKTHHMSSKGRSNGALLVFLISSSS